MGNYENIKNFIIKPISHYLQSGRYRRNSRYSYYYDKLKINDKSILYECREGKSITGNVYAVLLYLLNDREYKNFKHIIVVDDESKINLYKNKFCNINIEFVQIHSKEYLKSLATCKYVINDSTFPNYFICKENQIYINLWHGTPLKHMGRDIKEDPLNTKNITRNFIQSDYMVMPNTYTTDVFKNAYYLEGIYQGNIIEEGYPRIDLTINTDKVKFKRYLREIGLEIQEEKEIILYAPTWKGSDLNKPTNDIERILKDVEYIQDNIDDTKYKVIIKVHPFLYPYIKSRNDIKGICVPDEIDTNELLSSVDILITDYSSIYFDFLVTEKPIIFYMWDKENYKNNRGLYIDECDMPGPIESNIEAVVKDIKDVVNIRKVFAEKYINAKNKFCPSDDGESTKRIVDIIFKNNINYNIKKISDEKEHILIYVGGMKNNGITSSVINLLNNIDYNKYNVSAFINDTSNKEIIGNIKKINPKCNKLFKMGVDTIKFKEMFREKYILSRGKSGLLGKLLYPKKLFKRRFSRYFGKLKFDYIIDFSGYSMYWDNILLQGQGKKIVYMHNDLMTDSNKIIDGKMIHKQNLNGVFSILDEFDELVSVSPSCRDINKSKLKKFANKNKFKYVLNSINYKKILKEKEKTIIDELKIHNNYLIINKEEEGYGTLKIEVMPICEKEENENYIEYNKILNKQQRIVQMLNEFLFSNKIDNNDDEMNTLLSIYNFMNINAIKQVNNLSCNEDQSITSTLKDMNKNNIEFNKIKDRFLNINFDNNECIVDGKKYFISKLSNNESTINITLKLLPDSSKINIINIGRLSPEKDQEKLIRSFKEVHEIYRDTVLYIVGEGPLKERLQELIRELDLEKSVLLLGQIESPFFLLDKCDCFVLSSNYEGQPMVLLEAMILGKKIIATNIEQNKYVLKDGYGKIVDNSILGLTKGIIEYIKEDITIKSFDYKQYNEQAMESFYKILHD